MVAHQLSSRVTFTAPKPRWVPMNELTNFHHSSVSVDGIWTTGYENSCGDFLGGCLIYADHDVTFHMLGKRDLIWGTTCHLKEVFSSSCQPHCSFCYMLIERERERERARERRANYLASATSAFVCPVVPSVCRDSKAGD
jgi:hypothetical protein